MTTALGYIIIVTVSLMVSIIVLFVIFKILLKIWLNYKDRLKDKSKKIYSTTQSIISSIIPSDKYIITILICSTLLFCSYMISNQNRYEMSPRRIFDTRTGDIYIEKTINVNKPYDEHGYQVPPKYERVWQKYDFSDKIFEAPEE